MVFPQQTNAHKIALDKSNRILDIYAQIAEKNEIIASWLSLMSMKPTSFETIDIDVSHEDSEEEIFLTVCSSTKSQQKAIVNSHERWNNHKYVSPKVLIYKSIPVTIYDRDEAISELNQISTNNVTAISSVVAIDKSTITDIKNNSK